MKRLNKLTTLSLICIASSLSSTILATNSKEFNDFLTSSSCLIKTFKPLDITEENMFNYNPIESLEKLLKALIGLGDKLSGFSDQEKGKIETYKSYLDHIYKYIQTNGFKKSLTKIQNKYKKQFVREIKKFLYNLVLALAKGSIRDCDEESFNIRLKDLIEHFISIGDC